MDTKSILLGFTIFLNSCLSVPQYGFLPGTEYPYFKASKTLNFGGRHFNIRIVDSRPSAGTVACIYANYLNDSEFQGSIGLTMVNLYLERKSVEYNFKLDNGAETITIDIHTIQPLLYGFGNINAYGTVQMTVAYNGKMRSYCVAPMDSDQDSPMRDVTFATRKTGYRTMQSFAISKALDLMFSDILNQAMPKI